MLVQKKRVELEQEAKATQEGKFCATPFGFDFVGITVRTDCSFSCNHIISKLIQYMEISDRAWIQETILLIGAFVGGLSSRQRKRELEEVNAKLRLINLKLREQVRLSF